MRKLIVLMMTSVLATGAVAQADTVNVTLDANDFIMVTGIEDASGGGELGTTDGGATTYPSSNMDPYLPGNTSPEHYRIPVTVIDPGGADGNTETLTQVSVCLFDADVITDPDETNCGNGFENPHIYTTAGGAAPSQTAATGDFLPESAIQMSFLTGLWEDSTAAGDSDNSINVVLPNDPATNPYHHLVGQKDFKDHPTSDVFSEAERRERSDGVRMGWDWNFEFHFAPLFAAKHGSNWKIRVVATYRDENNVDTNLELIPNQTHVVNYVGAFTELDEADFPTPETKRNAATVNYGDVIQGGDSTVDDISTGSYLTNAASDISLSADVFSGTNSEGDLDFSGNATPASGQAGLGCRPISSTDPLEFFTNPAAGQTSSLVLLSSVRANSNPGVGDDPRDPIDAEKHECTFYAGDSVTTGSYSNTVTVGIGES